MWIEDADEQHKIEENIKYKYKEIFQINLKNSEPYSFNFISISRLFEHLYKWDFILSLKLLDFPIYILLLIKLIKI